MRPTLATLCVLAYLGLAACALAGCGPDANGTYCQSGPKYGTQCYGATGTGNNNPQGPSQPPQEQPAPPAYR